MRNPKIRHRLCCFQKRRFKKKRFEETLDRLQTCAGTVYSCVQLDFYVNVTLDWVKINAKSPVTALLNHTGIADSQVPGTGTCKFKLATTVPVILRMYVTFSIPVGIAQGKKWRMQNEETKNNEGNTEKVFLVPKLAVPNFRIPRLSCLEYESEKSRD